MIHGLDSRPASTVPGVHYITRHPRLLVERVSPTGMSNDNPYSEAQFKTLKYMPDFPERFGSLEDARAFCDRFFTTYNHDHRHSGIGMHIPASVHFGTAEQILGGVRHLRAGQLRAPDAQRGRHTPDRVPETLERAVARRGGGAGVEAPHPHPGRALTELPTAR
jgi:hypothetical protein